MAGALGLWTPTKQVHGILLPNSLQCGHRPSGVRELPPDTGLPQPGGIRKQGGIGLTRCSQDRQQANQQNLIINCSSPSFIGAITIRGAQFARAGRFGTPGTYSDVYFAAYPGNVAFSGCQFYGGSDNVYDDPAGPVASKYASEFADLAKATNKIPLVGCAIRGGFRRPQFSNGLDKFANDVDHENRINTLTSGKLDRTTSYGGAGSNLNNLITDGSFKLNQSILSDAVNGTQNMPVALNFSIIEVLAFADVVIQKGRPLVSGAAELCRRGTNIGTGSPSCTAWA